MFAQVSQSDVVTCVYVHAARRSRLNRLLTADSGVYVSGMLACWRCLLSSLRLFRQVSAQGHCFHLHADVASRSPASD